MNLFLDKGRYAGLYELDFKIKDGDKVLDVGAGNKPYPKATHIIDMTENKEQRHNQDIEIGGREFIEGDVCKVLNDFEDNYFDFCYCSHVFEHIENLPLALDLMSKKCKRGFYAVPASDLEFFTTEKHFNHINLCRQFNDVLHIAKRPANSVFEKMSDHYNVLVRNKEFVDFYQSHDCKGFRFIWEGRCYWEEMIKYKFYENPVDLFPQLKYI